MRFIAATPDDELAVLEHEIAEFIRRGAKPQDIAIVTLAGQNASELLKRTALGSIRLARADAVDAPHAVIADTFLRFKGLERPFVFLVELAAGHASQYERRMHIAATRATSRLTVLVTPPAANADERLRDL